MKMTIAEKQSHSTHQYCGQQVKEVIDDQLHELSLDGHMNHLYFQVAALVKKLYGQEVTWSEDLKVTVNEYLFTLSYTVNRPTSTVVFHLKLCDAINQEDILIEKTLPVGQDIVFSRIEAPVTAFLNMMI